MAEIDMMTALNARTFAEEWIESWNAHALDRILAHYRDDVEYYSVFLIRLGASADGMLRGKEALKAYVANGLAAYPDLHFELIDVFVGTRSAVLRYRSVNGLMAAEVFEFDALGKISRVQCHYDQI